MLSESELDAILAQHVRDYNRPPTEPPIDLVRERVFQAGTGPNARRVVAFGFTVAAAAAIVMSLSRSPEADARTESANRALDAAIRSAERAAGANPGEPYYAEHLAAMRENAEHFRTLQREQTGASL